VTTSQACLFHPLFDERDLCATLIATDASHEQRVSVATTRTITSLIMTLMSPQTNSGSRSDLVTYDLRDTKVQVVKSGTRIRGVSTVVTNVAMVNLPTEKQLGSSIGVVMSRFIYTAEAHVRGGRNGHGHAVGSGLDIDLKVPVELGGTGGGTNPEELFAIGFAACIETSLSSIAERRSIAVGVVEIDSLVKLFLNEEGEGFRLSVNLNVTMSEMDDHTTAQSLIRSAYELCPYANATRGKIDLEISYRGESVALDD